MFSSLLIPCFSLSPTVHQCSEDEDQALCVHGGVGACAGFSAAGAAGAGGGAGGLEGLHLGVQGRRAGDQQAASGPDPACHGGGRAPCRPSPPSHC